MAKSETTRGRGRPPLLTLDEKTSADIIKLSGLGCGLREMAAWFGVSPNTWLRFRDANPRVDELIEEGVGRGKINLRTIQWKLAQKSAAMAMRLGEVHLDQQTKVNVEHSGAVEVTSDARERLAHLASRGDEPGDEGEGPKPANAG